MLIPVGEGGLAQASKVLLDQVRTVDKARLSRRLGVLDTVRMAAVDRAIRLSPEVQRPLADCPALRRLGLLAAPPADVDGLAGGAEAALWLAVHEHLQRYFEGVALKL